MQKNDEEKEMKKWEFQCPKQAFIDLIIEFQRCNSDKEPFTDSQVEEFVEKFLKTHFQDYNTNEK